MNGNQQYVHIAGTMDMSSTTIGNLKEEELKQDKQPVQTTEFQGKGVDKGKQKCNDPKGHFGNFP